MAGGYESIPAKEERGGNAEKEKVIENPIRTQNPLFFLLQTISGTFVRDHFLVSDFESLDLNFIFKIHPTYQLIP